MPTSIFISYSAEDVNKAKMIQEFLNSQPEIKTFFASVDLLPGDHFHEKIKNGLWGSDYLLILLSDNSISSPWVLTEICFFSQLAKSKDVPTRRLSPCILDSKGKKWYEKYESIGSEILKRPQIFYSDLSNCDFSKPKLVCETINELWGGISGQVKWNHFSKESGDWWEEEASGKTIRSKFDPEFPCPSILTHTCNRKNSEPLKKVFFKIKFNGLNSNEWRIAIILKKFNGDYNTECFRFFIADREKDWEKTGRKFAKDRYAGFYILGLDKATMTYSIDPNSRPPIKDSGEYTLILEIIENNFIKCSLRDSNSPEEIKFIEKLPVDLIEDIKQVSLCAYVREDTNKKMGFFDVEFLEAYLIGLGY